MISLLKYKDEIERLVEERYINRQKHPIYEYYIYNYSHKTQLEGYWNDITLMCRGLVLDKDYNIILRPLKKFFNDGEINYKYPDEPFEVYDKVDGSMFIFGKDPDNNLIYATRGSFESEQAQMGYKILTTKYKDCLDYLLIGQTYIAEVIYPANRIVCNYGNKEDLILITVVDNVYGFDDIDYEFVNLYSFPVVEKFDYKSLDKLRELEDKDNLKEGFVIKFIPSGFRCKVKFNEYLRLHRILTNVSTKTIWEALKNNTSLDEIIQRVPDEFYDWVLNTKKDLEEQYSMFNDIGQISYQDTNAVLGKDCSQKDFALYVLKNYKIMSSILFAMRSGRDYSKIIWDMLKPKYEKPFKEEI